MTQPTRTSYRTKFRNFATFVDGILDCAAAAEASRKPSRDALRRAGINSGVVYPADRG
jgi:hypothetical protein